MSKAKLHRWCRTHDRWIPPHYYSCDRGYPNLDGDGNVEYCDEYRVAVIEVEE